MTDDEMEEKTSFAELLEASSETPGHKVYPGEKVSGRVAKISRDTLFVDWEGRARALLTFRSSLIRAEVLRSRKAIGWR